MNKKEIAEIKKLYTYDRCQAQRFAGCYVDGNKNKILSFKEAFLSQPEEEIFKYLTIFRNSLGGTIGKNLLNMEFPLETEMEGGSQEFLLKLRDSHLQDDALLDLFYDKVIDNYVYGENYLILLIDTVYDVPKRGEDGMEQEDASDYAYEHILCSICPVNLSKEGLRINTVTNSIENRIRDWLVEPPQHAFLFPAFTDRNTDIHKLLYFTHKAEEIQPDFIGGMLGCVSPLTAKNQAESFVEVISEALGEECSFETVKSIHETMTAFVEEHKEEPDPVSFDKADVKRVLETAGVSDERIEHFEETFEESVGTKQDLMASNIVNTRTFNVSTPNVSIKVAADRTDLIETREIDGKKYLMIEVTDAVEVNGITVQA